MEKLNRRLIVIAVMMVLGGAAAAKAQYSGGSGTAGEPYKIGTAADWVYLTGHSGDWDKYFVMTADVDLAGVTKLAPVARDTDPNRVDFQGTKFTGIFDGSRHVIRHAVINQPGYDFVGLFGYVGKGGKISNLGVEEVKITGWYHVGGLVGQIYPGTITSCYTTGTVTGRDSVGGLIGSNIEGTITSCYTTGAVTGRGSVGGLVGHTIGGTFTTCYTTGMVKGTGKYIGGLVGGSIQVTINTCYTTGAVSGTNSVGGLAGSIGEDGMITACYATGSVSGSNDVGGLMGICQPVGGGRFCTTTSCFAAGAVSGTDRVGGLVGSNVYGTIKSCYATGAVSGKNFEVGGLVGKNNQGTVFYCYATGKTTGGYAGGFCGTKINLGVTNKKMGLYVDSGNFWDMDTAQTTTSAMGTGKTTVQMKTKGTFTEAGWDLENVWRMGADGADYPRLRSLTEEGAQQERRLGGPSR